MPTRLSNWEVPADQLKKTSLTQSFDKVKARTGRTKFIVDDRGYLASKKPGVQAFTTTAYVSREVYAHSKPQWPEVRLQTVFGCENR